MAASGRHGCRAPGPIRGPVRSNPGAWDTVRVERARQWLEINMVTYRRNKSEMLPPVSEQKQHTEPSVANMKAGQRSKIRELEDALVEAGYTSLDEQAQVLGLPRSTSWSILKSGHKSPWLSANTINRIFTSPRLPLRARSLILEYIVEKAAGMYGGNGRPHHRFASHASM